MGYRFWTLVLLCAVLGGANAVAQTFPLKGKQVAVYLSKKHFEFSDKYQIPLSQFIITDRGEETPISDVKLQTLISLGDLLSEQLAAAAQADSAYFLNEIPGQARAFMGAYDSDENAMSQGLAKDFPETDYVLVVNPMRLGTYVTSSVYSRSNRLITERVINYRARMQLHLFNTRTGKLEGSYEACFDERKSEQPEQLFAFHLKDSRTGKFLANLFSQAVHNMNQDLSGNCPQEDDSEE